MGASFEYPTTATPDAVLRVATTYLMRDLLVRFPDIFDPASAQSIAAGDCTPEDLRQARFVLGSASLPEAEADLGRIDMLMKEWERRSESVPQQRGARDTAIDEASPYVAPTDVFLEEDIVVRDLFARVVAELERALGRVRLTRLQRQARIPDPLLAWLAHADQHEIMDILAGWRDRGALPVAAHSEIYSRWVQARSLQSL